MTSRKWSGMNSDVILAVGQCPAAFFEREDIKNG
nr:MAG TPA: hypothetical protein [Caudoviricetes sp.]